MFIAYRGFSVILFAPIAAALAVLLTSPRILLPVYSGIFMERMAAFIKLYFPIFLLGAIFGKVIEVSGLVSNSGVLLRGPGIRDGERRLGFTK